MDRKLATQFQRMRVQITEPRSAFDMHIAVWAKPGRAECVIGAPSVEALREQWEQITHTRLDESRVQHVIVMLCEAPEGLINQAKAIAARSFRGSGNN
jgi:hypothetical protein